MNQDRPKPYQTAAALAADADRKAREAAALRENLRRRKAQARARDPASDSASDPGPNHPPAKVIVES